MLVSVAGEGTLWEEGEEIEMTPEQVKVWADGIRGELVRETRVDTPERGRRRVEHP
jgi:NADH dehydrogenase FAD-containing subunit